MYPKAARIKGRCSIAGLRERPTASLDDACRDVALAMMHEAKEAGAAIVLIAHDVAVRDAIADRLLTLTPLQDAA